MGTKICPKCNHEYCNKKINKKIDKEYKVKNSNMSIKKEGDFIFICGAYYYETILHEKIKKIFFHNNNYLYCCKCGEKIFNNITYSKDYELKDIGDSLCILSNNKLLLK